MTRGQQDIWANFQWTVTELSHNANDTIDLKLGSGGYQFPRGASQSGYWFVDNIEEELDQAGEWYLDLKPDLTSSITNADAHLMYCRNSTEQPQEPPQDETFVATYLKTLVRIRGSDAKPVKGLQIRGITFRHSEVTYLEQYETPSGGGYSVFRGAAVEVEEAEQTSIANCYFSGIGGNGILLSGHAVDSVIRGNEFRWVGDSAVVLLGRAQGCEATDGKQVKGTIISDNIMHELGIYGKQGTGVFQALSSKTTVLRNIIFNGPRAGILFNDGAGGNNR